MPYILIIINALLATVGQLLFKHAADFITANPNLKFPFYYVSNPWFYAAVCMFVGSTFVWTQALTKVPLSIAYPLASMAYVLTVIGSYYVFNEKITHTGVVGVLLIVAGITLTAYSAGR